MKAMFLVVALVYLCFHSAISAPVDSNSIDLFKRGCKDKRDDCHWIADNYPGEVQKYCNEHVHDAFIQDCKEYCGFCKAPAPSHAHCVDTRSDCSWIAENNDNVAEYCDLHDTDAFIKQCQATCGFCKAPAPAQECEDTRSDCGWILEGKDPAGYCYQYRNDPEVKKCAKTCGFCKAPAPPRQTAHCVDTRNDCSWIAENNDYVAEYCDLHESDAFIKQCQATCGFCKAPAPQHICEDTRSDCDTINHNGENKVSYCRRNRNDPAVRECAKTCGFC